MSNVTLETLKDAILSVGLNEPWPVAIWFVDRYRTYIDILQEANRTLENLTALAERSYPVVPHLRGVPTFTSRSQGASEAQLACRPKFCSTPGVWLEKSDGAHVQLDKEETDEPA